VAPVSWNDKEQKTRKQALKRNHPKHSMKTISIRSLTAWFASAVVLLLQPLAITLGVPTVWASEVLPNFKPVDTTPNSVRYNSLVSPRDCFQSVYRLSSSPGSMRPNHDFTPRNGMRARVCCWKGAKPMVDDET
jgi:hypothetical protein